MILCGIDPGKTGGIAFYDTGHEVIMAGKKMPLNDDKMVDVCTIQDWLINAKPSHVYIEKQSVYGTQGGGLTIGTNYGRLTAVVELCGLRMHEVTPREWQAALGINGGHEAHVQWCLDNWHNVPWSSYKQDGTPTARAVRHDGVAAAICIAVAGTILPPF